MYLKSVVNVNFPSIWSVERTIGRAPREIHWGPPIVLHATLDDLLFSDFVCWNWVTYVSKSWFFCIKMHQKCPPPSKKSKNMCLNAQNLSKTNNSVHFTSKVSQICAPNSDLETFAQTMCFYSWNYCISILEHKIIDSWNLGRVWWL